VLVGAALARLAMAHGLATAAAVAILFLGALTYAIFNRRGL
jgi:hypothetical protein